MDQALPVGQAEAARRRAYRRGDGDADQLFGLMRTNM